MTDSIIHKRAKSRVMTEQTASPSPDLTDSNAPKEKPWWPIVVTKHVEYLIEAKDRTGNPPELYVLPWVNQQDSRLFVKAGKLWPVHGLVMAKLVRLAEMPELPHNEARYVEVIRTEFDPTDAVQIQRFDLNKYADELNNALQGKGGEVPETLKTLDAVSSAVNQNAQDTQRDGGQTDKPDSAIDASGATSGPAAADEPVKSAETPPTP